MNPTHMTTMTNIDDALDRIEMALPDYPEDIATVRDYIHAIRADRDGAVDLVVSQEAELQRLREERDEFLDERKAFLKNASDWQKRGEAAEAEVRRLREGLRDIISASWTSETSMTREGAMARALLDDSPPDRPPPWECLEPNLPDGGGAK